MKLTSPAFEEQGTIPPQYTCDGEGVRPELSWSDVPVGTQSFVLIMDDPDIPDFVKEKRGIDVFDHWLLYNIPREARTKGEGELVGVIGLNSAGTMQYIGPCPPDCEHRYIFVLRALDCTLELSELPTKENILRAMNGHVLAEVRLVGKYKRI